MTLVFSPSTYSRRECSICGRTIRMDDVICHVDGDCEGVAHVACTKDGIERWCRNSRPYGDALAWDRAERLRWRASERRLYVHVGGGVLTDEESRLGPA